MKLMFYKNKVTKIVSLLMGFAFLTLLVHSANATIHHHQDDFVHERDVIHSHCSHEETPAKESSHREKEDCGLCFLLSGISSLFAFQNDISSETFLKLIFNQPFMSRLFESTTYPINRAPPSFTL